MTRTVRRLITVGVTALVTAGLVWLAAAAQAGISLNGLD